MQDNHVVANNPMCIFEPAIKTRISLEMMGTFCTFLGHVPSNDGLQNLPRIQLTITDTWVLAGVVFHPHQIDEDAKMDAGQVSAAMSEYLSRLSKASAVHSANQQLLQSVSAVSLTVLLTLPSTSSY